MVSSRYKDEEIRFKQLLKFCNIILAAWVKEDKMVYFFCHVELINMDGWGTVRKSSNFFLKLSLLKG